jgi:hypothetical protein
MDEVSGGLGFFFFFTFILPSHKDQVPKD